MPKNSGILQSYPQLSSSPVTPPAGYSSIYARTDGKWYIKNPDGTESEITNFSVTQKIFSAASNFAQTII